MTKKSKTLIARIAIPSLSTLIVAVIIWLITASIGEVKSYGQIKQLPTKFEKFETKMIQVDKKSDSICQKFAIHNEIQIIVVDEILKKLDKIDSKLDKLAEKK